MSWPIGKPRSQETRKKIGEAQKGRINSPESRLKMSLARKGKPLSLANRQGLSRARKLQVGEKAPCWKGGLRIDNNGYLLKYFPEHPRATSLRYMLIHRLVAEKALGRYLKPTEVVHHVNGIKNDNRNCNLVVCQDEHYHRLLHSRAAANLRRSGHRVLATKESGQSRDKNSIDARLPVIIDPFKGVLP